MAVPSDTVAQTTETSSRSVLVLALSPRERRRAWKRRMAQLELRESLADVEVPSTSKSPIREHQHDIFTQQEFWLSRRKLPLR